MEDGKLLRLLHKDPGAGMKQLMNQYAGLVYAVVKGKLVGAFYISTDIEDCVADVFSEFYAGLDRYDPQKAGIKSYLCVLARNHATDTLRKREKQRGDVSMDDKTGLLGIADESITSENPMEESLRREVLSAVQGLGDPDTAIIIRKYYLGESSKEIAKALKLTVSNVDTRTHRALNKLRKLCGGEWNGKETE